MENNKRDAIVKRDSGALMRRPQPIEAVVEPMADLFETSDMFVLRLDLPGATKERISLEVEQDRLRIRAVLVSRHDEEAQVVFSEIGRKRYIRVFNIGNGVHRDGIAAQFDSGVLTVHLPKTDSVKARKIHIN